MTNGTSIVISAAVQSIARMIIAHVIVTENYMTDMDAHMFISPGVVRKLVEADARLAAVAALVAHAKSKTPCAEHYNLLIRDLESALGGDLSQPTPISFDALVKEIAEFWDNHCECYSKDFNREGYLREIIKNALPSVDSLIETAIEMGRKWALAPVEAHAPRPTAAAVREQHRKEAK